MKLFKVFRSLLNLFQRDGSINEILFWTKLLFLKCISKAIYDLVLDIFLKGINSSLNSSFTENREVPF